MLKEFSRKTKFRPTTMTRKEKSNLDQEKNVYEKISWLFLTEFLFTLDWKSLY